MIFLNYIPPRYKDATLIGGEFSAGLDRAIEYVKSFKEQKTALIISGGVGCGKTYFAYAFYNDYVKKNKTRTKPVGNRIYYFCDTVLITSLKEIIKDLRRAFQGLEVTYDYGKIPFLIIDEIGLNYGTPSERIELFEMFNYRWENMLPTLCLTNLPKLEIFKSLGKRIGDRLFDNAVYIELDESSKRKR